MAVNDIGQLKIAIHAKVKTSLLKVKKIIDNWDRPVSDSDIVIT